VCSSKRRQEFDHSKPFKKINEENKTYFLKKKVGRDSCVKNEKGGKTMKRRKKKQKK